MGQKANVINAELELMDAPAESLDQASRIGIDAYCWELYQEYTTSQYKQKKLDERSEGRKRYKGDLASKTFPWPNCSNKTMMLEAIAVDNLEPRLYAQMIAEDDFVHAEPVGNEDVGNASGVQEFMNWAAKSNLNLKPTIRTLIHDLLLDGTKDCIPVWHEKKDTARIRARIPLYRLPTGETIEIPPDKPIPAQMLAMMGLTEAGERDGFVEKPFTEWKVVIELISIVDSFYPDIIDGWDQQPYMRLIYPTLYQLQELSDQNGGPYFDITEDLVLPAPRQTVSEQEGKDAEQERQGIRFSEYSKEIRILECYLMWENKWTLASFAVDRAFKRVRKQPLKDVYWHGKKPVKRFRLFPESNEALGTGIPAKISHFSRGIDDLYNQMVDSGTVEIDPWFFYTNAPGFNSANIQIAPGKGNPLPKGAEIQWPQLGVKSPTYQGFIQVLLGFFERLISLADYQTGRTSQDSSRGAETYSGMNLVVQEGNIKFQYAGSALRDTFSELLTDCFCLYQQYIPWDAKRRIFENDEWAFEDIDVMALQGRFDVLVSVSQASANKMLHRKESVELYGLLRENPLMEMVKVTERLLKAYGIDEPKDLIQPQFRLVAQAVAEAPELAELAKQIIQRKAQENRDHEIEAQAKDNMRRQDIEREVERPVELKKLFDQVKEAGKRKMISPLAQRAGAAELAQEFTSGG